MKDLPWVILLLGMVGAIVYLAMNDQVIIAALLTLVTYYLGDKLLD